MMGQQGMMPPSNMAMDQQQMAAYMQFMQQQQQAYFQQQQQYVRAMQMVSCSPVSSRPLHCHCGYIDGTQVVEGH